MATGSSYAVFNSKALAGTNDFGVNLVNYVRTLSQEAVAARWNVDGVFSSKLTIAASGANKIQINGATKGTDGIGHILDITQLADRTAQFQNTNAILYYVGMFYAESPSDIRVNPRTGAPQYVAFQEYIGLSGSPDNAIDNGNGTISFDINGITEAGVSNAGRIVRVYKKIPASGALTKAIAVEDCTVFFGAANRITTVGTLGQTTVSTTASDYVVVLLGVSVKRNTDLRSVQGCCFIGTVTGNGGTPSVFSNVDQVLLQTFSDASQITYAPTLWLSPGATTVDVALNTIVSGLLSNSSSTPGGLRVGVYPNDFVTSSVSPDHPTSVQTGGIGNQTDGTLSASATVEDVLKQIDISIRRDRTMKTGTDTVRPGHLGLTTTFAGIEADPDAYFLKKLANGATTPFDFQAATVNGSAPYVMGENCLNNDVTALDNSRPRITMHRDATGDAQAGKVPGGIWKRVQFDTTTVAKYMYLNGAFAPGGIYEDVIFRGSNFAVGTADTSKGNHPLHVRNFFVDPLTGATRALASAIQFGTIGTANNPVHGLFENGVVRGPIQAQTSPAPVSVVEVLAATGGATSSSLIGSGLATADRPLKFSNTIFVCQHTGTSALSVTGHHKLVFDNCHFHGITAQTVALISILSDCNVTFRDCVFFAQEGSVLLASGASGLFDNCIFVTGSGGTTIAQPQAISAFGCSQATTSPNRGGLTFRNCQVIAGTSAVRTATAIRPVCIFGADFGYTSQGITNIDGLKIRYFGTTEIHRAETLMLIGGIPKSNFRNISIDFDGKTRTAVGAASNVPFSLSGATNSFVVCSVFSGGAVQNERCYVDGLALENIGNPASDLATSFLVLDRCTARSITTQGNGDGTARWFSELLLNVGANIRDYMCNTVTVRLSDSVVSIQNQSNEFIGMEIQGGAQASGIAFAGTIPANGLVNFPGGAANDCAIYGINIAVSGNWGVLLKIDSRDLQIHGGRITTGGTPTAAPVNILTGRRRVTIDGVHFKWNATTVNCVTLAGSDSLITGCTFFQSSGATAAINNTGTGNTITPVITSSTL
jgi:hypothetical protein